MKIAILGAGNMGGATAKGLAASGYLPAENITVTAAHLQHLDPFKALGMNVTTDNAEAVKGADMVILAVKPWIAPVVMNEIRRTFNPFTQLVVTMMPGVSDADMRQVLGDEAQIAYVIPNTAIAVGESMTFVSPTSASREQTDMLVEMFSTMGRAMAVPFTQLSACTALASCGIAFAMRYIRASVEGGVQLGVKAHDGQDIVAQTVKGAAALLCQEGAHAESEIDKVTTPGGITIKGLNAMEKNGFTNAVIEGLLASKI